MGVWGHATMLIINGPYDSLLKFEIWNMTSKTKRGPEHKTDDYHQMWNKDEVSIDRSYDISSNVI